MTSLDVRILHQTIAVPFAKAYAFAHQPENFPKWAAGMSSSLHRTDRGWIAETPVGKATVRFSEANSYGVLDHWVKIEGQPEIHIPLRLLPNGEGTEVELVLFRQPTMSDHDFERDEQAVKKDLASLKTVLERSA